MTLMGQWQAEQADLGCDALLESDLLVNWSLALLARQLGQSPRTLQRWLVGDGLSLLALRRASQIRHASLMLLSDRVPLTSIGFACGFSASAHFTRAFRKPTGLSSKEFRSSANAGENQG